MRHPLVLPAALLALALAAGGCGRGTSATAPTVPITQAQADDVALQTALNLDVIGGDVDGAVGVTGGGPAPFARVRPAAVQWDTSFTHDGLTVEASRTFYDGAGNPLPGFGPTAARMVWDARAFGTRVSSLDTCTVGHHGLLSVAGLLAAVDTLTIDGAWDDTLTNVFHAYDGSGMRYFHWLSSALAARIRVPKVSATHFPTSGTLTFTASADRLRSRDGGSVDAHWNVSIVVTFDGTAAADVWIDRLWHYRYDLTTGAILRA